jgi:hypothetical protein
MRASGIGHITDSLWFLAKPQNQRSWQLLSQPSDMTQHDFDTNTKEHEYEVLSFN